VIAWFTWSACSGPDPLDDGTAPSPTATPTPAPTAETGPPTLDTGEPPGPDLVAGDANDLTLSVAYTVSQVPIRDRFDAIVTWSALTMDGWGDAVTPAAVDRLLLLEITVPPAEVAQRLAADDLGFDLLSRWEVDVAGRVFVQLSDLRAGATPFDPTAFLLPDPGRSWVLALAAPVGERTELRSAMVLVPGSGGASQAAFVDGGSSFGFAGALDGEPLPTSAGWDAWTLDWSGLATDALGRPYDESVVDELFVARYAAEASALGPALRDLPGAADAVWRMEVGGFTDARLEFARDADGGTFPGFTEGPTWIVGGRCTTCLTPFPAFAFRVEVR
jgi:hypothetical protein